MTDRVLTLGQGLASSFTKVISHEIQHRELSSSGRNSDGEFRRMDIKPEKVRRPVVGPRPWFRLWINRTVSFANVRRNL